MLIYLLVVNCLRIFGIWVEKNDAAMMLKNKCQYLFTSTFSKLVRKNRNMPNKSISAVFKSKFPSATHILWQQVDVIKWHVNFIMKKKKCTALFNNEGKWLETVTTIPLDKIPEQIKLTLDEKNNRDELRQIHHVQTPDRSMYELNLNNGRYSLKLLYDLSGKIVGKIIV